MTNFTVSRVYVIASFVRDDGFEENYQPSISNFSEPRTFDRFDMGGWFKVDCQSSKSAFKTYEPRSCHCLLKDHSSQPS